MSGNFGELISEIMKNLDQETVEKINNSLDDEEVRERLSGMLDNFKEGMSQEEKERLIDLFQTMLKK